MYPSAAILVQAIIIKVVIDGLESKMVSKIPTWGRATELALSNLWACLHMSFAALVWAVVLHL